MATNKWLNDLQTLKSTTNTLRETLRTRNVVAYDTDTLQTLVNKVPNLAPIELSDDDKWQPDPLWVFPDPNGTDESKTIRQIYDEDTMASSYTYRAIYQIRGDLDTIDLKSVMNSRTNADTFVLSDGTTYTNVTANTLNHTWDKSKDVIDSLGRRMRYVRVYTNSEFRYYILGFFNSSVWGIHKLSVASNIQMADSATQGYACLYAPLECLEIESTETGSFTALTPICYNLKKLVVNASLAVTSNLGTSGFSLREVMFTKLKNFAITSSSAKSFEPTCNIVDFNIPSEYYTGSSFSIQSSNSANFKSISGLDSCDTITNISVNNQHKLETLPLPPNLKELRLQYCEALKTLTIPDVCQVIVLYQLSSLETLKIPSSITSLTLTNLINLRALTLPIDFNYAINLSTSIKLEHDSLVSILENLKDLTGETAKTLTLGTTNLAKLTDDEKLIATNKNWTLA